MNNALEIEWRDIPGYDGAYSVSNTGLVRSNARVTTSKNGRAYTVKEVIRKPIKKREGYYAVILYANAGNKISYVHRLVALAFIPNPDNKPHVNHIDNDRRNNHVSNLEWCTPTDNMQHARKQGRMRQVSTDKLEKIKNLIELGLSGKEISRQLKVSTHTIKAYFPNAHYKEQHTTSKETLSKIQELINAGASRSEIVEQAGVSTATIAKYFPDASYSKLRYKHLTEKIKELISEGLSYSEIGRRLSIDRSTVSRYFPRNNNKVLGQDN